MLEFCVCKAVGDCTKTPPSCLSPLQPLIQQQAPVSQAPASSAQIGNNHVELGAWAPQCSQVEVQLVKFEVPKLRATVQCGRCRQYESKTEDSAADTWYCSPCSGDQYVVDPNNAAHSCQACPLLRGHAFRLKQFFTPWAFRVVSGSQRSLLVNAATPLRTWVDWPSASE